jgi:apolipoprotein D and lipocalin family protein
MKAKLIMFTLLLSFLSGCTGIPSGITAVRNFDISRYEGTWYEIARLDHSFERGLSNVSATYTPRTDGGINVLNKGYDKKSSRWKQAKGRAYFIKDKTVGRLKVTFFWPFYGAYNIIALDHKNYSYAMVCGPNRSYLWLLARQKSLGDSVIDELVGTADALGFEVEDLIFVEQNQPDLR